MTMFHWDLPQAMLEIGGWPSEFIVDYFVDYTELLFKEYGDKVKCVWGRGERTRERGRERAGKE